MATTTLQPANIDTFISSTTPTTNFGTNTTLSIRDDGTGLQKAILKFDFSAFISSGATIDSATLMLYNFNGAEDTNQDIYVYRLLRTDWVETEATYNIYKTSSNWGTAGAENSTTDYTVTDASLYEPPSTSAGVWYEWNVTNQVQTALDSVSGVAHFLVHKTTGTDNMAFRSSNYTTDTSLRPKLEIVYTEVGGFTPKVMMIM